MTYDPEYHHRRAMRLNGYDYAQGGAYYVTICTHARACILSTITDGQVGLTVAGQMVEKYWLSLPHHYQVEMDTYIIMPNHVHGIVVILQKQEKSLFNLMRSFKSFSAKAINRARGLQGVPVWQGRYYDHVVRDENDLNRIREYIAHNPLQWSSDENYMNG